MVFFYLLPIRKAVAIRNLNICFPRFGFKTKQNIVKEAYVNLAVNLLEIMYFPKFNAEKLKKFIYVEDFTPLFDALKKGKGVLVTSGHFSNWELSAFAPAAFSNQSFKIIAKIQANKSVNDKMNEYREKLGNEIIEMGVGLRKMFSMISDNRIICFLMDQNAHPDYSVYADFFGKSIPTYAGPAKLALKYGCEIIFGYLMRDINYKYKGFIKKIDYSDLKEYNEKNIGILTQRINDELEKIIKEEPGQWLWFHRRFKNLYKDMKIYG